jgi:hypothetical protein
MIVIARHAKLSQLTAKPAVIRLSRSAGPRDGAATFPQPRSAKPALWHLRMPSRSRFVPVQHRVMPSSDTPTVRIRTKAAKTNQRLDSHTKAPRLSLSRALPTLLRVLLWPSLSLSWQRSATEALFENKARDERSSAARSYSIHACGYKAYLEHCQEKAVKRIPGQFFFTFSDATNQGREECSRC